MHRAKSALMAVVAVVILMQSAPYQSAASTGGALQVCSSQDDPAGFQGSWYSADNVSRRELASDSVLEGDRVTLVGTFHNENLSRPVIRTECRLTLGIFVNMTGQLIIPSSDLLGMNLTEFAWCRVDGIRAGDNVRVTLAFSNLDCDLVAWWAGTDNTSWTYENNLLVDQMSTTAHPEFGSFTSDREGSLVLGVFNSNRTAGDYTLAVDTRAEFESTPVSGTEIQANTTEYLSYNMRIDIAFLGWVDNDSAYRIDYSNVTIVNYFAPEVLEIVVSGEAPMITFQWTIHDRNALEIHTSGILVSWDSGLTFQWIARDLHSTNYTWDSSGFPDHWHYARIVVRDSHGDMGSADWWQYVPTDMIPHLSTTTSEPTTTGSATTPGIMSQLSVAVTLASSAVVLTVLVLWTRTRPRRMAT